MKNTPEDVIKQFHKLHEEAIKLKEMFDLKQSPEVIAVRTELYNNELENLVKLIPRELFLKGDLSRHSTFLSRYTKQHNIKDCYNDIYSICLTDIFVVEDAYIEYLKTTDNPLEKEYNWNQIHPAIQKQAQSRFENAYYTDAVEASMKEINHIIKQKYKAVKGVELDGQELMRKAFTSSEKNNYKPVFKLADNSTKSGKNIQQGYMDIFAGAWMGIRSPKTHGNLDSDPDEAWEMIVLASHLMRMWDKFNKEVSVSKI